MLGLFLGAKIRTSTTNSSPSSLLMSVLCSAWRPVVRESPKLGHGAGRGRHFLGSGFFVSKTWIEPNLTSQLVHRTIFWLVVWDFFLFFHSGGNFIIPTDELIFFRGLGIPPTSFHNPFRVFQNFND